MNFQSQPVNQNDCPECGGSGWEKIDPSGAVRRCACMDSSRIERLIAEAKIPRRYEHCDLESYKPDSDESSQKKAKADISRFLDKYPLVDRGLLFLGSCGVGKTHLAVSVLKHVIKEKGADGIFYDFRDLLREIQSSWSSVSQSSELEVLRPVLDANVLVLDELGSNKPSDWVRDTVAYIINCRYNDKKLTIFTSNYLDHPINEVDEMSSTRIGAKLREESLTDRIGVRLRSRLYEMCKVIEIKGKDFRKEVRQTTHIL